MSLTQRQHTTVVCRGGGLNKYQALAGDGLQRPLLRRSRFQPRLKGGRSPGRFASGRTRQLSRELLPAATRRENQELKTDAPSGHGLAAALDIGVTLVA